jgi:hypothetical protein
MAKMPVLHDAEDILLRLDKAHKALHKEISMLEAEQAKAQREAWLRHAPFVAESKSVFLQVQAEAYRAGFDDESMDKVLSDSCDC